MKNNKHCCVHLNKTWGRLQANRELVIGQTKIKRFFRGYGGVIGTVKIYSVSNDVSYLNYSDGHHKWIPSLDIPGLVKKLATI